jgi:hypothetical protein
MKGTDKCRMESDKLDIPMEHNTLKYFSEYKVCIYEYFACRW